MSPREAPRAPEGRSGGSFRKRLAFHALRWAPLLLTALVTYALFPPPVGIRAPVPAVGRVTDQTVIAPFAFEVRKSADELAREGEARAQTAQPVYRFSPTAYDSAMASARSFFAELEQAGPQGADLLRAVAATRADRKSTRLNSSHIQKSRMPSSA